jgi:hypothetical protein
MRNHPQVGREPPSYSAPRWRFPQVIFTHKNDGIFMNGWIPVVTIGCHLFSP